MSFVSDLGMKKILIVDDNAKVRELLKLTLSDQGFDISEAQTAEEALEIAKKDLPDVILMDLLMPGTIDGKGATRLLKSAPETNICKVILLTGVELNPKQVLLMGADGYLRKPFSPFELLEKVSEVLQQST
jgi:two-component system phosphate regulon response regulator PhoB